MVEPTLTFSVFTPTYNRAHTLDRVYRSLKAQTYRDFEWLIVDDGSTDGTRELVEGWAREADFPVRYEWQENRGKHFATNRGIELARGELFITADSDDEFPPEALETFRRVWESILAGERPGFAGAAGLCVDQHGRLVGDRFPESPLDSTHLERKYRYKVKGEKWGFVRTEVMREFPFVETAEMSGFRWSDIGRKYKTRFFNEVVRIYYVGEGGSLSSRDRKIRKPLMGALRNAGVLNDDLDWFHCDPVAFIKNAVHYGRFSLLAGWSLRDQRAKLKPGLARLLWVLALPAAWLVSRRDLFRGRG
jgi:glycosyltransferase involved in cell wall biosynthesis